MRGYPLLRTILILPLLVASGFHFVRLTAAPATKVPVEAAERQPEQPPDVIHSRVHVTLSGAAETVSLFANAGHHRFGRSDKGMYSADGFGIAGENPVLEFKVDWAEASQARRFAKVVVEAEGKETFTHVFDSSGDIDDFVELPF